MINKTKKEIRLKKVVKACDESIKHWVKDVLEEEKNPTGGECALCNLSRDAKTEMTQCEKCIINEFTAKECEDTGFDICYELTDLYTRLQSSQSSEWPINYSATAFKIKDIKTIAIKSEINFLKALKALAVERLKNEKLRNKIKSLT